MRRTLTVPTITPEVVAAFAEATGDDNPLHTDPAAARSAGLDAVPAHGMLSMAFLARLLTDGWPLDGLTSFHVRFTAMTPVGSAPTFTATTRPGPDCETVVDLEGRLEDGAVTVQGRAVLRRRR
jgi:acyl dehydratase